MFLNLYDLRSSSTILEHFRARESLLSLVAVVEDVLHRVDVRRLGSGDQEGVASQRPVQIVADVGAVL